MAGSLLPLLLAVILPAAHALPPKVPIAVLLHPEDYPFQHTALKYALQYINADHELLPGTELMKLELNFSQADSFSTYKRVCGAVREGVAAVIGPRAPATTGIVQSVCETMEVPNLQIYPEVPEYKGFCHINLYPAQESVAQAIADVVRSFLHWSTFTVLYETDEGLVRLQEVLKAQGPARPKVTVRQFLPGRDQRKLLKEVSASNETRILLDCATDHVLDILQQAREVKMISVYNSYFITSLDTHTVDLSEFEPGQINVTLLRLVDPEDINVQRIVNYWMDKEEYYYKRSLGVTAKTVRTEMALMHDAVFLLARALHRSYFDVKQNFSVESLECGGRRKWIYGLPLANYMNISEMDGMTGRIQFDKSRRRVRFKLDVVQYFTGKFTRVGFWETGQGVTRTQSETEMEVEIQKSLQSKKLIVASRIAWPRQRTSQPERSCVATARFEGHNANITCVRTTYPCFKPNCPLRKKPLDF